MKIIEKEFNVQTQEETIIERDATPEEIKKMKAFELEVKNAEKLEKEKVAKRQELLDKLGITADEAKLLLG